MSKRPSIIGDLKLVTSEPESTASAPAPEPAKSSPRRVRPDIVHTSVYLPKPVYKKLREIAFTTDQKIHDVIIEGIDQALRRYGHPSVAELRAGRGGE